MQNPYVDFSQHFQDQTVALLNLPPLTEFEKFLRSRFRGTGVGASTFSELQTKLVGGTPKRGQPGSDAMGPFW